MLNTTSKVLHPNYNTRILKIDNSGNKIWEKVFNNIATSIIATKDKGYLLIGINAWVTKLDKNGNILWERTYKNKIPFNALNANDSGYIIAGKAKTKYSNVVFIMKIDKNGKKEWDNNYVGNKKDMINSIINFDKNSYIFAGATFSYGLSNEDLWIVKIDNNGNYNISSEYRFNLDYLPNKVCLQMLNIDEALSNFINVNETFPETSEGLSALIKNPNPQKYKHYDEYKQRSKIDKLPVDIWGNPFIYKKKIDRYGVEDYELISYGADGKKGGIAENKDISSYDCFNYIY